MQRSANKRNENAAAVPPVLQHAHMGNDIHGRPSEGTRRRCSRNAAIAIAVLPLISVFGISSARRMITSSLNPTVYVRPQTVEHIAFRDDLSVGKSCEWSGRKGWSCRDCGNRSATCLKLRARGMCRSFQRQEWDDPPQFKSHYDSTYDGEMEFRTLSRFGVGKAWNVYYERQPLCSVSTCFDLTNCNTTDVSGNFVLPIYINKTEPSDLLENANASLGFIRSVDNYEDACLILVTKGLYKSARQLKESLHWRNSGGKNTLIWNANCFFGGLCAQPFNDVHFEFAAIASASLTRAHYRAGYDLTLPLPRKWGRPCSAEEVDIHRPRSLLLSFRGSIQNTLQPYYQHRWLAAEYWEEAPDVLVDVQCKRRRFGEKYVTKPYKLEPSIYDVMMWNSTFGFAPGGSAVGSYRFGEILSTGGIPVVTHDFVPPLAPDIDWNACLVRVSEARVIDLPRLLRLFSRREIRERQRRCWQLSLAVFGEKYAGGAWRGDTNVFFTRAMHVWGARISNALQVQRNVNRLNMEIK